MDEMDPGRAVLAPRSERRLIPLGELGELEEQPRLFSVMG